MNLSIEENRLECALKSNALAEHINQEINNTA